MYDLTNLDTFEKLSNWLKDIETVSKRKLLSIKTVQYIIVTNIWSLFLQYGLHKEQLIIVGNKSDLENERQVSKERGEKVINFSNIVFFNGGVYT
jgi:GTPase SAR1 family protein